jgi:S1-C subfamily serine protease/pSer/pThr/pTyr-binding forkhead associated (FHA) protein
MTLRLRTPAGATFAIDRALVIGRLPECDVVLADGLVSGRHFELTTTADGATLVDLQSSNGTFINGQRVTMPTALRGGESIEIGSQRLMIERVSGQAVGDFQLSVRTGPDAGTTSALSLAAPLLIGRDADAELRLVDPLASARHCRVMLVRPPAGPCPHCRMQAVAGDAHCSGCGRQRVAAEVEDLGSANGTLVDGTAVPPMGRADLLEGGEIQVGDSVIVFGSRSDPVAPGASPTVIRAVPTSLAAAAAAQTAPGAPAALSPVPARRIPLAAWIVGGIAIVAIAIVLVVALGGSKSPSGSSRDAAWVMEQEGKTTVQVFACDDSSEAQCDDTFSSGSGSVIDLGDGLILTNFHVIANDAASYPRPNLSVGMSITGEKIKQAEVVGYSACDDLALIRVVDDVSSFSLKQVEFAESDSIRIGEGVVVLGYPGTVGSTEDGDSPLQLTTGSVSALNVVIENYVDLIQTDAPINHGNSGGPMFDLDGKQIGVASLGDDEETQGIHYAISVAQVQKVLPELKSGMKQTGLTSCPN